MKNGEGRIVVQRLIGGEWTDYHTTPVTRELAKPTQDQMFNPQFPLFN